MSRMNEAIDRIAICAENKKYPSLVKSWLSFSFKETKLTSLDDYTKEQIDLFPIKTQPRLTKSEIDEIVKDYSYQLPVEFYDLYQRGNGYGLPIGLSKDYSTYDNYFGFPGNDTAWECLSRSMDLHKALKDYDESNSKLLPLFTNEWYLYAVMGTEKQQKTSSVWAIDSDIPTNPHIVASNLTNIMLAFVEKMEDKNKDISNEYLMNKYEIYDDIVIDYLW